MVQKAVKFLTEVKMGQAKNRGTFEQRQIEGIAKKEKRQKAFEAARLELEAKLQHSPQLAMLRNYNVIAGAALKLKG